MSVKGNITQLDWTEGKVYGDNCRKDLWYVHNGQLLRKCDKKNIYDVYVMEDIANIHFKEAKREEYYLRHKYIGSHYQKDNYLNYFRDYGTIYLADEKPSEFGETKFTGAEIEMLKRKFNTDLSEFERVKV